MIRCEYLYDGLHEADAALSLLKDWYDTTLKQATTDEEIVHFYERKIPTRDRITLHMAHLKTALDEAEQEGLERWLGLMSSLVVGLEEHEVMTLEALNMRRIAGLRLGSTSMAYHEFPAAKLKHKQDDAVGGRNGEAASDATDGCLYCTDDSCASCHADLNGMLGKTGDIDG
jgi:hypothetical protein